MSYALAASYLFILLSTSSFFSCYAVLCLPMQRIETMLILILSLLNDAEVSSPANANAGVMLHNKSNEYKGLVNKDLKLLKQKISAGR
ncbi:hypothetical protein HBI62_241250 [Parastagonospora nodorum]|nr:hypothetical protein HBI62_241250 [Parastagonospora nodorum]KAH6134947.1 hypothetical protein HBI63_241620 [Parastagonospora nodorum]